MQGINNTTEDKELKQLSEEELQFCELYVNGGLEFAGRPKKCYVEVFGEKHTKNPNAAANYLMNKPHVLAHIKSLLSSERFEMETMAVKLQVTETLKAVMDENGNGGLYRPLRCPSLSGSPQGRFRECRQSADGYFPHQTQGRKPTAY